ncbi:pyridine nucleotide-disulfide oxidoreductase domain-containing protein 1 [Onthophagus taurus]|uniref:pyridine nucleotide-disulfide oxidoreductase domain-containing protein 1 n=1 Tax=Onthophagus taurus TaxID=166361 RepID=UPI000C2008EE|nr:pyridine nucleotide-disulfide oxidoreductase domain-containing protein 1 [Onthophagus taurus]
MEATFVIVGGGIAGVSCAETLAYYEPNESIILISESSLIKTVTNLLAITQSITSFNIEETTTNSLTNKYQNVNVLNGSLLEINDVENFIIISKNIKINYKYLCLCYGAKPKLIPQAKNNPFVVGIRDTDSVDVFAEKLAKSKKVVIVGNGGIASELVYKIQNTEIEWVIKDNHITATFVDPGASEFFQPSLKKDQKQPDLLEPIPNKRMRYEEDATYKSGAALGPDWYKHFQIKGACELPSSVKIHYKSEVFDILNDDSSEYPIKVILTTGDEIYCNLVVSATGVEPKIEFKTNTNFKLSPSNEIIVNETMKSSIPNIYAAGDCCSAGWEHSKHWFPMKLWTQARQMGNYAAKCMSGDFNKEEVILQDFCFELFTHTTRLFGYKVILLGLYNGQKLDNNYEILFRMTKEHEYAKFILQDGRLQGAVLIGDTDLEETVENLILSQLDLSPYKEDLLNPDVDIEDYFD